MLNKIEHKTRYVSFIEMRELPKMLRATVAEIDATATQLEAGRIHPVTAGREQADRQRTLRSLQ